MTETIRYSQLGLEDISIGTGSFEVELADGRHVVLTQMDVGRILANPALSTPFRLQAYERLTLPDAAAGSMAMVTDDIGGVWLSAGTGLPWAALNAEVVNVKDPVFGARGDGVTDDTDALNAALATGKLVFLPPGTYLISSPLILPLNGTVLRGSGLGLTTIFCANGADFPRAIYGASLTNLAVRDLTVDLNQAGRGGALLTAMTGIHFEDCVESSVVNCLVKNGLGHTTGGSGVGVLFGGANTRRGLIRGCIVRDCGVAGKASDAFYTKGQQNLIVGCIALNCNDTAFVIENSDQSGIIGCTARGCGSGGAITAATTGSYTGNFIDGLTVYDWSAAVSGGLQLGTINGTATLDNTSVANVIMERVAGSGPAINVTQDGGLTTNVDLRNCRIKGAGTGAQGILIRGSKIVVMGCHLTDIGHRCIQIQIQSSDVLISNNYLSSAAVGEMIRSDTADDVTIMANVLRGDGINVTYGVFFANTAARCQVVMNVMTGTATEHVSSDAGTVPLIIAPATDGRGGLMMGSELNRITVTANAAGQLGLNEFASTKGIKWGRPIITVGGAPDAPSYIDPNQTAWMRVVDSDGFHRLIPIFNLQPPFTEPQS